MSATAFLRELGSPAELEAIAAPAQSIQANTHVHLPPNFSAFSSVEDAVDRARRAELDVLGASNYYDYRVYTEFARLAVERGVFPLFGIEIVALDEALRGAGIKVNDPGNPGKFYVCGKGIVRFDPGTPYTQSTLEKIRQQDTRRIEVIIDRLNGHFAERATLRPLAHAGIVAAVAARSGTDPSTIFLQERHVAHAFEAALGPRGASAVDVRALMKANRPAHVPDTPVRLDVALELVRQLGGIPCYPLLADGAPEVSQFEQDPGTLAHELWGLGIAAVEVIPQRNAASLLDDYVSELRGRGLIVTAGTEHNTIELGPMAPRAGFGQVGAATRAAFAEGAAVVIAHQFLVALGRPGYTVPSPNTIRDTAQLRRHEAHIQSLARLGRVLLARFQEQHRKEA